MKWLADCISPEVGVTQTIDTYIDVNVLGENEINSKQFLGLCIFKINVSEETQESHQLKL